MNGTEINPDAALRFRERWHADLAPVVVATLSVVVSRLTEDGD
jgi:hypothetical protein